LGEFISDKTLKVPSTSSEEVARKLQEVEKNISDITAQLSATVTAVKELSDKYEQAKQLVDSYNDAENRKNELFMSYKSCCTTIAKLEKELEKTINKRDELSFLITSLAKRFDTEQDVGILLKALEFARSEAVSELEKLKKLRDSYVISLEFANKNKELLDKRIERCPLCGSSIDFSNLNNIAAATDKQELLVKLTEVDNEIIKQNRLIKLLESWKKELNDKLSVLNTDSENISNALQTMERFKEYQERMEKLDKELTYLRGFNSSLVSQYENVLKDEERYEKESAALDNIRKLKDYLNPRVISKAMIKHVVNFLEAKTNAYLNEFGLNYMVRITEDLEFSVICSGKSRIRDSQLSYGEKGILSFIIKLAINDLIKSFDGNANRNNILLMDEPTAGWDEYNRARFIELITNVKATNVMQIFIATHHIDERLAADNVIELSL